MEDIGTPLFVSTVFIVICSPYLTCIVVPSNHTDGETQDGFSDWPTNKAAGTVLRDKLPQLTQEVVISEAFLVMEILLFESQVLQDNYCSDLKPMSSDEGWHLRFYVTSTACGLNHLEWDQRLWDVCKLLEFNNWVRGGAVYREKSSEEGT